MIAAATQQIKTAYEDLNMQPDEISEDTGYDLTVVKATLMQFSSKYRKDSKKDEKLAFTYMEAREMQDLILSIARNEDNDGHLRFKAARYVVDDKKGRLDIVHNLPTLNVNVLQMNEQMQRALRAVNSSKELPERNGHSTVTVETV